MSARILAVEDDPTAIKLYGFLCDKFGYELQTVISCDEAGGLIRLIRFDLIIMDWQLRGFDGLTGTRALREIELELGIRTPIIAMTAHALPGDREKCLAAGMDDYLSKPFSIEEFKNMIEKWINKIIDFPATQQA
jgi:CheY-like chemotaxis protein